MTLSGGSQTCTCKEGRSWPCQFDSHYLRSVLSQVRYVLAQTKPKFPHRGCGLKTTAHQLSGAKSYSARLLPLHWMETELETELETWTWTMKHSHCRPLRLKLICSHLTSIISLRNNVLFNLIYTYMPLMILASTGLISLLSLQDYCENCWVCCSTILLSSQSWLFYQHQDPTQKHPLTPEEKVEVTGMQSIRHRWETSGPSEDTTNTVSIHSTHQKQMYTVYII